MNQKTIWDPIQETQTIFIEKEVFTIEYTPEILKYRDQQMEIMVHNCKDTSTENKKPYHMILQGGYATGKTVTIKKFFEEVEKKFPKVNTAHINCKNHRTAYENYLKIYERVFNKKMSVGGLSTFTLLNKVIKKISKTGTVLLVASDDINHVKTDKDLNHVLYNFLRAYETDANAKISVFSVSNDKKVLFLDPDVQTVFSGIEVNFPRYSSDDVYNILNESCRLGLYNGAISDSIIKMLVNTHIKETI